MHWQGSIAMQIHLARIGMYHSAPQIGARAAVLSGSSGKFTAK
jgi:hypothetical protein